MGDADVLRRAGRAFGPQEAAARERCVVAEAEIALVSRDLGWSAKALDTARATLEAHADRANAAHARYLEVRRLLLIGRIDEAERTLAELDPALLSPAPGPPTSWWSQGSRFDASKRRRRALRSLGPKAQRNTHASLH